MYGKGIKVYGRFYFRLWLEVKSVINENLWWINIIWDFESEVRFVG